MTSLAAADLIELSPSPSVVAIEHEVDAWVSGRPTTLGAVLDYRLPWREFEKRFRCALPKIREARPSVWEDKLGNELNFEGLLLEPMCWH